jgi:hypothetical protein
VTGPGPSYAISWDTLPASNGPHTLSAVASDAAGNTATSSVNVTVNNPLTIFAVSASSITSSGATITWTTNRPADSQVAYGTTSAYGSTSPLDSTLVTNHSVILSGLTPSTTYHYQALSHDSLGALASSADFTFTTAAPGPPPLFVLHGDPGEVSGTANGSVVTPPTAPPGFTGTVVVQGAGSVNFSSTQSGNGVYFLNCCTNTNAAYYKFPSAAVGSIFNVNVGEISFDLKSRYSFSQRQASAAAPRYAFDVRDNSKHLFFFYTQVVSGYLQFTYALGSAAQFYYVPTGTADALFGNGITLKVRLTWDGALMKLYLNDVLVKSSTYSKLTPNWTANSNFNIGAYEYLNVGGYNSSDDIIDEFKVK